MKIRFSKNTDALYIYLNKYVGEGISKSEGIVKTTTGDWPVHVDWDKEGNILGIEIMNASKILDIEYLKKLEYREWPKD